MSNEDKHNRKIRKNITDALGLDRSDANSTTDPCLLTGPSIHASATIRLTKHLHLHAIKKDTSIVPLSTNLEEDLDYQQTLQQHIEQDIGHSPKITAVEGTLITTQCSDRSKHSMDSDPVGRKRRRLQPGQV